MLLHSAYDEWSLGRETEDPILTRAIGARDPMRPDHTRLACLTTLRVVRIRGRAMVRGAYSL